MKLGAYEELDAALYIWLRQQQEKNVPVSGSLLQEKAKVLFEQLYPDSTKPFNASTGFQWRFSKVTSIWMMLDHVLRLSDEDQG